ncbi:hypothetical protein ACFSSC_00690 [Corynebacterium mendelii]|uniref:Polysaccharide biosynthesis protein n=1 Tax=Corynebacterium mendelii TaxID=2765362 RepID=A0A939E1L7_9CORY|nr:hypothetical protein [Corynebacterium mendelii]MBN9643802.1 hypothetical protein [Corynebacterium mendelii]
MRKLSWATAFAALSGFVILYIASWALPADKASVFIAYWSVFFAVTGLIDGLMQETTRAVSARAGADDTHPAGAGRPVAVAATLAAVLAAVVCTTGWWWMGFVTGGDTALPIALMAAGLASYCVQAVVAGIVSGLKLWDEFAWLVAVDSGIRLVVITVAWMAGAALPAFYITTVIGAATWVGILAASSRARAGLAAPVDVDAATLWLRSLQAMTATGATALMITGFPAFIKATTGEHTPAGAGGVTVAGIMLAVMLTRAPILVPLQRFQSALIVRFVDNADQPGRGIAVPVALVAAIGIIGAVAAWLIGPWIMRLLFAPDMQVPGPVLGVLTLGAAATGILMVTGTTTLAAGRHSRYVAGWITATAVAFACLMLPLGLATTVPVALIVGPAAGIAVHLPAIVKDERTLSHT